MRAHITRRLEDNSQKLVFVFHLVGGRFCLVSTTGSQHQAGWPESFWPVFQLSILSHCWSAGFIDAGMPQLAFYVGSQACMASAFTSRPSGELDQ